MKLFCFSYAGGSAEFYKELANNLLDENVEVIALDYPGHGTRRKEHFLSDFYAVSLDMIEQIRKLLEDEESYALMGYSMGSITVAEIVCRILEKAELPKPDHIILAAHEPKPFKVLENLPDDMQDSVIMERTISFGAVPDELVNNKTFWRMYMPLYKADYGMVSRYDFEKLTLSTDIDTSIFYSESDTPYKEMKKWCNYFVGDTKFYKFSGNHFFMKEHIKEIADIISKNLSASQGM